jgi:hypothetical protein
MKTTTKLAVLASVALGAASAQAVNYTGDLLVGFSSGSGNDFIYDLGPASSLAFGQQWHLGGLLAGFNLGTVSWGVIGDRNVAGVRSAWTTTGGTTPLSLGSATDWGNLNTPTASIFQNFSAAGAGQTLYISAADDNSWNQQTINGALTTQYVNAYGNPNIVGLGLDNFYELVANGSDPNYRGGFSLVGDGTLTYVVPEPSIYALALGMGLLAFSFRRVPTPRF